VARGREAARNRTRTGPEEDRGLTTLEMLLREGPRLGPFVFLSARIG
jgi:hypothetical protein